MTSSDFWHELCSRWKWNSRIVKEKSQAKEWFDENDLLDQAEIILKAVDRRNEFVGDQVRGTLGEFLRGGWESFDDGSLTSSSPPTVTVVSQQPVVEVQEPAASWSGLAEPEKQDPASIAFEEVWSSWPPNPGRPEREENARKAFRAAYAALGHDDLVTGCRTYADWIESPQGSAMAFPKHLTRFVQDREGVEQWADRGRAMPDPESLAAFRRCYADYPEFEGKERREEEGLALFRRHIKPEDRYEFWCAIMAYKWTRAHWGRDDGDPPDADDGQYVVRFNNFTVDWRAYGGKRMKTEIALRLAKAPALKAAIRANQKVHEWFSWLQPDYSSAMIARGAGKKHWTEVVAHVCRDLGLDDAACKELLAKIVSDQFPA